MNKAIGYIRLSNQDQSSYSTDNQLRNIQEYCNRHNLELVDCFEDNGESSYTFDRADFKRLEAFVKKNRPNFIIVYHLDRFSRNLAEALLKIKEFLSKYNVRVRDINELPDLDDNDPNTFLMRSFRFMMAESELHRITKRIKDGMMQGALNGRHLNMAPFGYKNERDAAGKPIIVVNEQKAMIVQFIFRQFLAGSSIETIRTMANKIGFTQKGTSAIQRILSNQVYIGKVKVPGSGKYVPGIHEPIIGEYDFWQAQNILNNRSKITFQPREEVFLRNVLKDFKGHLFTAGNSRSKSGRYYWYYVSRLTGQNLSATKLHDQFYELLQHLQLSDAETSRLKNKIETTIREKIKNQSDSIKLISKELDSVRKKIATVEEKYLLNPDISQASYKKSVMQLQVRESELIKNIMTAERPASHLLTKMEQVLPVLGNIAELFKKLPLAKQQSFIRAVFDNSLTYYNDSYRTPFLHPLFAHKELMLKEKRLLQIEQPSLKLGITPIRTRDGS